MSQIELRPYQKEKVNAIIFAFKEFDSVLLQMPTGTGKTIIISEIAKLFQEKYAKGDDILILSHRKVLIKQIREALEKNKSQDVIKRNINSNFGRVSFVQTTTAQKLVRKVGKADNKNYSLIIIDEAHHTPAKTYVKILETYKKEGTKLLGVTATPSRLDNKPMKDYYQHLEKSKGIKWFIENDHLSDIKHLASNVVNRNNISSFDIIKGDYDVKQIENYYLSRNDAGEHTLMADIIDSYEKNAANKKCIVYAATQKHAKKICERFQERGMHAKYIISDSTTDNEREKIIDDFRKNKFRILVNVEIFTEGFDCPDVEVVQIARPTKSLVKYLQMVGRVTRKNIGKQYGLILDNACLWQEHGISYSK